MIKIIKTLYDSIIRGRITRAEYEVAVMLHRTEFRNESFDTVLHYVQQKNVLGLVK